jgi:carbon monoxide dehydrogenase subunit G
MKVELAKSFPMPAPADATWRFLQNIEAVAACMPGAKITERLPTGELRGTVTVRIGPATVTFRGGVEVRDTDAAGAKLAPCTLRLVGKGVDSTGTSGASLELTAQVVAIDANSSKLIGKSDVTTSGKVAAFGGRMMNSVADQILNQFAINFAAQVKDSAVNPASSSPPNAQANELNGVTLVWAVIKDWLRGVFGRSAA